MRLRLVVTTPLPFENTPLDPDIDFAAWIRRAAVAAALDPNSIKVIDLATGDTPVEDLLIELPLITLNTSRLDALMQLNAAAAPIAAVVDDDSQAIGLVHHRQLTEQLFEWQAPV